MHRRAVQHLISSILTIFLQSGIISAQIQPHALEQKFEQRINYPVPHSYYTWRSEREVRNYITAHPESFPAKNLAKKMGWNFVPGTTKSWYADSMVNGTRYSVPSTCRAVGTHCYVFVEDASWNTRANQTVVDSVRVYFDQKTPANPVQGIYQMDVDAFGDPPDVDGDPKIIILLLDIKDGYSGSGGYVVGYFHPFNEIDPITPGYATSNFAEIYFLDTTPLNLLDPRGLQEGLSTTAHEFQHMINFHYYPQSGRLPFLNEGCSLVAEVNCGYPIFDQTHFINEPNHYLLDWRENDLTNVLHDYARAARFFIYVRDQAGMGLFKPMVASTFPDQRSIDEGLLAVHNSLRFTDLVPNWFIANILDDRSINPLYGYLYPNLPKVQGRTYYKPTVPLSGDIVQNYAAQYLSFISGSNLHCTFSSSQTTGRVKAVELSTTSPRVLDVAMNSDFYEPDFGSTYKEVHFAIMNTDPSTPFSYSYSASGTGGDSVQELMYDTAEPLAYYEGLPNDTMIVSFPGIAGAKLDSIRVALRRAGTMNGGVWTHAGQSSTSFLGSPLAVPISASIATTPGLPYPVPWTNWATVDLRSYSIDASNPFVAGFINEGVGSGLNAKPRLMFTALPIPNVRTSFVYSNDTQNGKTPGWYYYTYNAAGDSVVVWLIRAYVTVGTQAVEVPPLSFTLNQNYPNPVTHSTTTIRYQLPSSGNVKIEVYDILGRNVTRPVDGYREAGIKFESLNLQNLSNGVYFYRLEAGNLMETKKLLILKE